MASDTTEAALPVGARAPIADRLIPVKGAAARSLELLDFALRHRGLRDAVLALDGSEISVELIEDCYRLGGLGVPLAEMLCLITDQELDVRLAPTLGPTIGASGRQVELMSLDRRLAHGVLRLGQLAYPQEAALVRYLVDQIVADSSHDESEPRDGLEPRSIEFVREKGFGLCGWSLHSEALRRGLVFRHLTPPAVANHTSFAALVSSPRPLRRVPLTALRAISDFELAADGDASARGRVLGHLIRVGRSARTAEPFLDSALARMQLARMQLVASSPRLGADVRWPQSWVPETAPVIPEPLATVLVLGQRLAFAPLQFSQRWLIPRRPGDSQRGPAS